MFIMNACWEASDEKKETPKRMSQTLSHAGVAVSITNITDIMSFAIGRLFGNYRHSPYRLLYRLAGYPVVLCVC